MRLDPGARDGGRRGDRRLQTEILRWRRGALRGDAETRSRHREHDRAAHGLAADARRRRGSGRRLGQPPPPEHGIGEPRPRLPRPLAELAVGEARASARPGRGVDPEERAAGRRSARTSPASSARPSSAAPSRRAARSRGPSRSAPCRPKPGSTPTSPGNWTPRRLVERLARDERRLEQLAAEREQVAQRRRRARQRGRAAQLAPRPSGASTASARYARERHLGPLRDELAASASKPEFE